LAALAKGSRLNADSVYNKDGLSNNH
jgi:hypothetical protein